MGKPLAGFLNETGGHRIQRVSANERRGRVHSSTVTVAVLEGSRQKIIGIDDNDLTARWFSGTGKGGQHRNKHQTSVELTHIPTGLSRSSQTRSRETSMKDAREALEEAVAALVASEHGAAVNGTRNAQIGIGMRSDRRRTYRFQEDRVVDHLTGMSAKAGAFMRGRVDLLWPDPE